MDEGNKNSSLGKIILNQIICDILHPNHMNQDSFDLPPHNVARLIEINKELGEIIPKVIAINCRYYNSEKESEKRCQKYNQLLRGNAAKECSCEYTNWKKVN